MDPATAQGKVFGQIKESQTEPQVKSDGIVFEAGSIRAEDPTEVNYLACNYLATNRGYIRFITSQLVEITPEGWNYLANTMKPASESRIAFVAMWFDDALKNVWEKAIKLGIEDAGYDGRRSIYNQAISAVVSSI